MRNGAFYGLGITFGVIVGVILGVITEQWWWIGAGVAVGVTFGAIVSGSRHEESQ